MIDATEAYSETVVERRDFPLKLREAMVAESNEGAADSE